MKLNAFDMCTGQTSPSPGRSCVRRNAACEASGRALMFSPDLDLASLATDSGVLSIWTLVLLSRL
jgi:hypothetical protein